MAKIGHILDQKNEFLNNFSEIIGNSLKEMNPDILRHYFWRFPL